MKDHPKDLDLRTTLLILLLSLLWGANPVAIKIALPDSPPLALAWMRFVLGGLTVLIWAGWNRTPLRIFPGEGISLLILGVIFTLQIALLNLGVAYTTAANASVLLNTYPLHIALLAHFFVPGDQLTVRKAVGVLIAYLGVFVLFVDQLSLHGQYLVGGLLTLASAVILGIRWVYLSRKVQGIEPVKLLLAQVAFGVPAFFLGSQLTEAATIYHATGILLGSLLYQGIIVAGFNFILALNLTKVYKPSSMAAYQLTTPLFGVVLSWLILGERLTPLLAVGTVLVGVGIALTMAIR